MRIILLGASGFVGTNIRTLLAQDRWEILALLPRNGLRVPQCDEVNIRWVTQAELFGPDISPDTTIVSLAGTGNPSAFEANPTLLEASEMEIAELICKLTVAHSAKTVIYLSTAGGVYGEGRSNLDGDKIFSELDNCAPISIYGAIKFAIEKYLSTKFKSLRIDANLIIFRATNVYGKKYNKSGTQG